MAYLRGRNRRVRDMLLKVAEAQVQRGDEDVSPAQYNALLAAVERVRQLLADSPMIDLPLLAELAAATDQQATARFARALAGMVPLAWEDVPLQEATLRAWVERNVSLIQSIDDRYLTDVQRVVAEAQTTGTQTRALTETLRERFNVSASRAELIARDQLGKLDGQINEGRSRQLGVKKYRWSTSGDERVRRSHEELDGKVFSWDAPPAVGHPGSDFQCRCTSEPVFEDEEEEEEARAAASQALESGILAVSPISTGAIVPSRRQLPAARRREFVGQYRRVNP
jgi:SPP1 gp7 family putative phage head morphogenesis protein